MDIVSQRISPPLRAKGGSAFLPVLNEGAGLPAEVSVRLGAGPPPRTAVAERRPPGIRPPSDVHPLLAVAYVALPLAILVDVALAVWVLAQQYNELAHPSAGLRGQLEQAGLAPDLYAGGIVALEVITVLGFLLVAAVIAWRRAQDWMALFVALMLAAFGAAIPGTCYALTVTRPIWSVPGGPLQALGWLLLLPFACLFPDGRFVPSWSGYVLPLWVVWVVAFFVGAGALTEGTPILFALTFLVWAGGLGAGVLAQIYRYRSVSTIMQQQQTKWVVLGFALAIPGLGVAVVPHIATLTFGHPVVSGIAFQWASLAIFCAAALLIPLALGIAILRHRLWDIDLLISRTLVYGLLITLLAAIYGSSIALLQLLVRAITGQTSDAVIVVSTLSTAALVQPLRQR
ncbi:MAG TPA: hypothetical protein VGP82_08730, partial [Ktedonobacterales bacterium]|nr:hypothetical protein [Ktedonobacterales bacterium]